MLERLPTSGSNPQYRSRTNRRRAIDLASSYAPFDDRFGRLTFFCRQRLVGNHRQQMRDGVQARRPLVVGADDVPGGDARVGLLQHHVARAGVVVPARARGNVHRTELPLAHRILDAGFEPPFLLVVADFHPQLDQNDPTPDHELLDLRTDLQEPFVLIVRAEAHHVLDAGAVVPAPIEDDHFAGAREVLQVALHVDLASFHGRMAPGGRPRGRRGG